MPDKYFGSKAGKVTIKGGPTSRSQRQILGRALQYADKAKAPYAAKVALISALIVESEAKNLKNPSADGYGSYGVLQGRDIYHPRKKLLDPEYQFSVFLGTNKKWPKGFTSKGNAIELAKKGMRPGDIAQTVEGSAYPDRYGQVSKEAQRIIRLFRSAGGGAKSLPVSPSGGSAAPTAKKSLVSSDAVTAARRQQIVKDMISEDDPTSPLLQSAALNKTFEEPKIKVDEQPKAASKEPAKAKAKAPAEAKAGKYTIAAGADRKGVKTNKHVLDFAARLAGRHGKTIHIGTGTNHSQMTTSGNVSDHWAGNAIDIPASGPELTRLGQRALLAAGLPWSKVKNMRGGIYNVTYKGRRAQIIFNTTGGGNHYNHLHIGLK